MRKLGFEVLEKINQWDRIHNMADSIRITARGLGLTLATVFLMFVSNNSWAQSPSAKWTIKALKTELGIDNDWQHSDVIWWWDGDWPDLDWDKKHPYNHSSSISSSSDTMFVYKYNNVELGFDDWKPSRNKWPESDQQRKDILQNTFEKIKEWWWNIHIKWNFDTYPTQKTQEIISWILNTIWYDNDFLEDNGFYGHLDNNGLVNTNAPKIITNKQIDGSTQYQIILTSFNGTIIESTLTYTWNHSSSNDQALFVTWTKEKKTEIKADTNTGIDTWWDEEIPQIEVKKCKPNKLNTKDAQRFVYDFKEKSQDRTAENYCPVIRYFVTPAAVTQAWGNLWTRMAQVTGAINDHDNQSYIDHNYTFSNESWGAINVSGLTMSETNSQWNNNVWFTGITQDELLYNLTVYQYDQWWDLGLAICLQASTENWNPEQANLIEWENITWTAWAVMMVKLTSWWWFDNVRCVHGFSCHIRGATHPDNPTDTPHAPSAAVNFATASPNNTLWKGTWWAYLWTTTSVNTNGSPNIAPCAPLALTDIINFSWTAVKEWNNRLSLLSVQAQNDGESARWLLERFVLTSDPDSWEWEWERRTLSYSEIDLSNKPKWAISFNIRDRWPSLWEVNYYRLKIIDKDWAVSYSNEIEPVDHRHEVEWTPMESDTDFKIFWTLTDNSVHFDLWNNERWFNNWCLLDASGKVITFFQVPNWSYEWDIDVSNLPAWTYYLRILDKEWKNCSKPFIVY